MAPLYWDQIRADRARTAEMEVLRQGQQPARLPGPDRSSLLELLA